MALMNEGGVSALFRCDASGVDVNPAQGPLVSSNVLIFRAPHHPGLA